LLVHQGSRWGLVRVVSVSEVSFGAVELGDR